MRVGCLKCGKGADAPGIPGLPVVEITFDGCPTCSGNVIGERWWDAGGWEISRARDDVLRIREAGKAVTK